jgi:splicing factor U2AF subunit
MHLCHPNKSLVSSLQASQRLSRRKAGADADAAVQGDMGWTPSAARAGGDGPGGWVPRDRKGNGDDSRQHGRDDRRY